jgi:2-isopropylmalate synthase
MTTKIHIADMTLGAAVKSLAVAPGFKEKLEIARNLEKLGVDVIELAAIEDEKVDSLFVRTVCGFVKNSTVSLSTGLTEVGVETAWKAVSGAKKPRLSVSVPLSPALMEYSCKLKPASAVELVKTLVAKCKAVGCKDIEFVAVDATRADPEVLEKAVVTAVSAGATVITICDNAGNIFPQDLVDFVKKVRGYIGKIKLGYLCESEHGLALAFTLMSGADEVKTAIGSIKYVEPCMFASGRLGMFSPSLNQTELDCISARIQEITEKKKSFSSIVKTDFLIEAEITLTAEDGIEKVSAAVKKLGYELDAEDTDKVFDAFSRLAAKKPTVSAKELDAIVASVAADAPPTYKLGNYSVTSSNAITSTASICLEKDGEKFEAVSLGDGPIDAAFLAMEKITGRHFELDDFQISAVTEGREAMGSALVKLRDGAKLYSGQGISTDIIRAAIRAYLSAVNKIIYEEKL